MHQSTGNDTKNAIIKTLAIIGFIVGLVLAVWLAVQAVRLLPSAFSTLASIAENLRSGEESEFTVATDKSIVNSGEPITLSWTLLRTEGEYTFSYECAEGISAEIRRANGATVSIDCDSEVTLPADENRTQVTFESEKNRFTDVRYTVRFAADKKDLSFERSALITLVNPDISENRPTTGGSPAPGSGANEEPAPQTGGSQGGRGPVGGYITVPTVVTEYPVSNPNGYSDLEVTFLGVGTLSGNRFTKRSYLEEGERGALQFAVRNVGTKTSSEWYFSAELPTDPSFTFSSSRQDGLRPNERQIITLQFDNVSDRDERIEVRATGGDDTRTANNRFSTNVDIR